MLIETASASFIPTEYASGEVRINRTFPFIQMLFSAPTITTKAAFFSPATGKMFNLGNKCLSLKMKINLWDTRLHYN